jgi:hypothetical protein
MLTGSLAPQVRHGKLATNALSWSDKARMPPPARAALR